MSGEQQFILTKGDTSMTKFLFGCKKNFCAILIGFTLAFVSVAAVSIDKTYAQQTKIINQGTKINSDINELGFVADENIPEENYVVSYYLDGKKNIVPYSVLNDNTLIFRAPKTAPYELINNKKTFRDMKYNSDISFVTAREILSGVEKEIFSPDTYVTRAMFAQILANLDHANLKNYHAPNFVDVDENSWYCPAISWALSQNIVVSNENSLLFHPNQPITREQMASMLYRYSQNKNFLLWQPGLAVARPPFNDLEEISDYATDAVTRLNWSGVILGDENGNFEPKAFTTRAQVCSVIRRFIERMAELN